MVIYRRKNHTSGSFHIRRESYRTIAGLMTLLFVSSWIFSVPASAEPVTEADSDAEATAEDGEKESDAKVTMEDGEQKSDAYIATGEEGNGYEEIKVLSLTVNTDTQTQTVTTELILQNLSDEGQTVTFS